MHGGIFTHETFKMDRTSTFYLTSFLQIGIYHQTKVDQKPCLTSGQIRTWQY
ncbi:uncharacterized protein Smp_201610 [Schistosoma mansoni]|uniref:uncharacterized protein n=1 Tax=Schistosoma mansoni TaxID=6183 RepID=UPI00022DC0C8|nr:uncharacterized protein Smp_201610 [Schistosoma mansoni]|eukprot:XP_018650489.1 uncharacterized protein Smp_201610 [Schistosoma mansoni]